MARRENGRGRRGGGGGGVVTCSYNFDSLFSAPCHFHAEKRDDVYEERERRARDKRDRVRERWNAHMKKEKDRESTPKKRGKRSNWADAELA